VIARPTRPRARRSGSPFAPGEYRVLVRHGRPAPRRWRDHRTTAGARHRPRSRAARSEAIVATTNKGGSGRAQAGLHVEAHPPAVGAERKDGFTDTLQAFGYKERTPAGAGLALAAFQRVDRRIWLGGSRRLAGAPSGRCRRAPAAALHVDHDDDRRRSAARSSVQRSRPVRRPRIYAQLGAGVAMGSTRLTDQDDKRTEERFFGWCGDDGRRAPHGPPPARSDSRSATSFDYAPVIDNLTGDTTPAGGHRISLGASYAH